MDKRDIRINDITIMTADAGESVLGWLDVETTNTMLESMVVDVELVGNEQRFALRGRSIVEGPAGALRGEAHELRLRATCRNFPGVAPIERTVALTPA